MFGSSGHIFWDLDGTLIDSVPLKGKLFAEVFHDFPEHQEDLLAFHLAHGGLNRSEKIRRMGVEVLGISLSGDQVAARSARFGELIEEHLREAPLAPGAEVALHELAATNTMHVVTAMPNIEAHQILEHHGIAAYFQTIYGHPTPKTTSLKSLMDRHNPRPPAVLLGDSSEDSTAADRAGVAFIQVRLDGAAPLPGAVDILDGLEKSAPRIRQALENL